MAKKKREELKDWSVTLKCTVTKVVYCPQCTEGNAKDSPFEMAQDEQEVSMEDWEVLSIKEET